ncbi:MAG: T9SS type B sorting domain-containing protein [Allomuricauda sp.]
MNLRLCYTIFAFFVALQLNAQLEASVWYFGWNAGLDFKTGTPVTLVDGQLDTTEGCATISDALGNLLFYTDGIKVYNKNHQLMPNGTDLLGHFSSTQSGIIVPKPNAPNIYYIFTCWLWNGYYYSEVDMTADGGLGDVVNKNVPLLPGIVSEKLTAVNHANGTDIWVIGHGHQNDQFLAYRVTPGGVITTPVESRVGIDFTNFSSIWDAHGYLKASPDGSRLAICHEDVGAEVLDFDNATGIVSNPVLLMEGTKAYGAEFSPSGQVLYLTELRGDIYQYDLNAADVRASELNLTNGTADAGALQLAIDGKMYATIFWENKLSVINNPDTVGPGCMYQEGVIDLGSGTGFLGLPPFIQSYFLITFETKNLCFGDTTEFSINTSDPIVSILWDFGDGNTSTVENASHVYAAPGNYTVNVTVTTASETKTETKEITISERPVAHAITNVEICHEQLTYELDLTSLDVQLLGTQDPASVDIGYFTSQVDADNNTNVVLSPVVFDQGVTQMFARISNQQNGSCYDTTSFDVVVKQAPELNSVTDWTVCDDDTDGQYAFDLSTKDTEVLNGQDAATFNISYHSSQADADAGTNPLGVSYTNTLPLETVFFRIESTTYPECYESGTFNIQVISQVVAHTPADLEICDPNNDGNAIFDLTQVEVEVLGSQNPASLVITYHDTQAEADANINPLPTDFNSSTYQKTVYIRVANTFDSSCYDTNMFQLNIFDTPEAPVIADWRVCDDNNDGVYLFDLSEKANEILAGTPSSTVFFYEMQADAALDQNRVLGTFQNITRTQIIYFRLENNGNANCYDVGQFTIQVFDTPTASAPTDIVVCDSNETGSYLFDLTQKDMEILNGQDPSAYEVLYFASESDALNNDNALSATTYENSTGGDLIHARVQNPVFPECFALTNFSILVNPLPQSDIEDTYALCPDSPDLTIDAGFFESYNWQDSSGTSIGTGQYQSISTLGDYSLIITKTANGVTCSNTINFEVVSSGAPESFTVTTSGISDQVTLTVDALGIGSFEYSLDGVNYQNDNHFEVFPGRYTIYVRDPFECRTLSKDVIALGYQKFFSPNGDGFHESWNVIGADQFPGSKLFIYDRYGKLLRQISPLGKGWDGRYLGRLLPSSDYWFRFEYDEGEIFTGHFALKR